MSWQWVEAAFKHAPGAANGRALAVLVYLAHRSIARDVSVPVEVKMSNEELASVINGDGEKIAERTVAGLIKDKIIGRRKLGEDKSGRPIYAHRGCPTTYILPVWPAPPDCSCQLCRTSPTMRGTEHRPNGGAAPTEESPPTLGGHSNESPPILGGQTDGKPPQNGGPKSEKAPPSWGALTELANRAKQTVQAPASQTRTPTDGSAPTEAWQIIADALPEATPDEITKVQSALNNGRFGKVPGLGLLKTYAREGVKLQQVLVEVRETRSEELAEEIKQIRADNPKCPHGEPGGNQPHPTTGTPLCPQCRRGDTKPTPDRTDHAGDYQRLYVAATGHPADGQLLIKVANQISILRRKGVSDKHIADATTLAALHGTDLVTQLRENAHASR